MKKSPSRTLIPRKLFPFENFPSLWEAFEEEFPEVPFDASSGLSLSEDNQNVYIEAPLPGMKSNEIKLSIEEGVLWVRGEKKEEEKSEEKKYYRKARSSFSYRVSLPVNVDEDSADAQYRDGVMHITFKKAQQGKAKEISFKS